MGRGPKRLPARCGPSLWLRGYAGWGIMPCTEKATRSCDWPRDRPLSLSPRVTGSKPFYIFRGLTRRVRGACTAKPYGVSAVCTETAWESARSFDRCTLIHPGSSFTGGPGLDGFTVSGPCNHARLSASVRNRVIRQLLPFCLEEERNTIPIKERQ